MLAELHQTEPKLLNLETDQSCKYIYLHHLSTPSSSNTSGHSQGQQSSAVPCATRAGSSQLPALEGHHFISGQTKDTTHFTNGQNELILLVQRWIR